MNTTPDLSNFFFQNLFDKQVADGFQPILQIIESRFTGTPNSGLRVRISDGFFSYSGCGIPGRLVERFQKDKLDKGHACIRVTHYILGQQAKRASFTINDYEIISLDYPIIGQPASHSGNPDDYRGISNTQKPVKREVNSSDIEPPQKRSNNGDSGSYQEPPSPRGLSTTAISVITPYVPKWRILGVVSQKENIRDIKSLKGTFRVFNFTVTDKTGNSIRISGFGELADKFFPIITDGLTYYISGSGNGSVRPANKRFNTTGHDYELCLQRDSEVNLCNDHYIEPPKFKLNAVSLNNVKDFVNECVDILAVIDRVSEPSQVIARADNRQLNKRDVFLVDKSGIEITFTVWGDQVAQFDQSDVGHVIGIKGASIREFNGGFSMSTSMSGSIIKKNPEGPATNELYAWYKQERPNADIKSMSAGDSGTSFERDIRLIGMATQHGMGRDAEKGCYFTVCAMVNAIKTENAFYQGCPTEGCKKKVIAENNQYRCEKCNATFDTYKNVLMLSLEITDFSGGAWLTLFEDKAVPLLGITADNLAELQRSDSAAFEAVFEKIRFQHFCFRVGVRYDMYNDQQQMRWSVYEVKPRPVDRYKRVLNEVIEKNENF